MWRPALDRSHNLLNCLAALVKGKLMPFMPNCTGWHQVRRLYRLHPPYIARC